jgi:hypothetical protein
MSGLVPLTRMLTRPAATALMGEGVARTGCKNNLLWKAWIE